MAVKAWVSIVSSKIWKVNMNKQFKVKSALVFSMAIMVSTSVFTMMSASVATASETGHHSDAAVIKTPVKGDAAKGKSKAAACVGCHGRNGNSNLANYPKLAGQNAKYLVKQMQDFQSGARVDPIMKSQVAGKSLSDLEDMAAYFSVQEVSLGKAKKDLFELGQKIYRGGNAKTGVSACTACHGPAGKGVSGAGFPAIGAQHASYTVSQLKAFRAAGRGDHQGKKRTNDGKDGEATMMQDIAAKMSDDEIEAVASYLSGLR